MQLVAYGAQDVYLTGNPEVTFFQAKYKRHTNFAMENIEQTVNGTAANSGRVSVTVARNGDLVSEMYLELESDIASTVTAEAGDCNWVAERAINNVELSIGGQRVDKHYQKWWRMYSELYLDEAKKATWGKMTTAADGSTVYLPLIFFFNRNPGLALPLIALQYHEVRIDFDLASDMETFLNKNVFKVWANYVYLDTEERRRFAQKGHEYLIEQVQHTGTDTITSDGTKQVRLSYNHPVKELVWCFSNTAAKSSLWNFTSKNLVTEIKLDSDPHDTLANCFVPTSYSGAPSRVRYVAVLRPSLRRRRVPSPPSRSSSTVRTVSRSRRASTSTRSRPTTITPAPPTPVSTRTLSRSSPRSTSLPALATSPVSITRRSRLLLTRPPPPRCTCSL